MMMGKAIFALRVWLTGVVLVAVCMTMDGMNIANRVSSRRMRSLCRMQRRRKHRKDQCYEDGCPLHRPRWYHD
ncbi:MAG: hypothetical protein MUF41_02995 [Sphingopyxis sp.]|jgi:hypothetical protein|nr:hypothetical protein [Sphingopyxis sp.]